MALAPHSILAKPVSSDDLVKAQESPGEWLTYGRDYRNWRYSPLSEITPDNAAKLAPVWAMSTGGQFGGLESTPLFRDGVLYFSADYARVFAVDARTGNIAWRYEPEYEQGCPAPDAPEQRSACPLGKNQGRSLNCSKRWMDRAVRCAVTNAALGVSWASAVTSTAGVQVAGR
jgi:glucose dehydrogenase